MRADTAWHGGSDHAHNGWRGSDVVRYPGDRQVVKRFWGWMAVTRFARELWMNSLLLHFPPPVRTPRLLGADAHSLKLTFEEVAGSTMGSKFPSPSSGITAHTVDRLLEIAEMVQRYAPRAFPLPRAPLWELLPESDRATAIAIAGELPDFRAAHGDLTCRNVIEHDDRLTVIDWEWAGAYPPAWDQAMLWYTFRDLPDQRDRVAAAILPDHEHAFWCSVALIARIHASLPSRAVEAREEDLELSRQVGRRVNVRWRWHGQPPHPIQA